MEGLAVLGGALLVVVFLAAVGEALCEFFVAPIWERFGLPAFWLAYIGALVAFALVFVSGQNLLADYLPPNLALLGRVLTALLAGRGSNWVHDFFSARRKKSEQLQLENLDSAYYHEKCLNSDNAGLL